MATQCLSTSALPDETPAVIRDMILIALDATEETPLSEQNRTYARSALVEALDLIERAKA